MADSKIKKMFDEKLMSILQRVHLDDVRDLLRGSGSHPPEQDSDLMNLGQLSRTRPHSKRPAKEDKEIIKAVRVLDDHERILKALTTEVIRCYRKHFPELERIIRDDVQHVKVVMLLGIRANAAHTDFSQILTKDVEDELKEAAPISKGTEISDRRLELVKNRCNQVMVFDNYKAQLYEYLTNKMNTNAPNLTAAFGVLVAARFIAQHRGIVNLSNLPSSKIRIPREEKERHAKSLCGISRTAAQTFKRKATRAITSKCLHASRMDAHGGDPSGSIGRGIRTELKARLAVLSSRANDVGIDSTIATDTPPLRRSSRLAARRAFNLSSELSLESISSRMQGLSVEPSTDMVMSQESVSSEMHGVGME